ncbi:MAG: serine hydrolase domain-containing protein [Ilumatobacteraceae bacterium]
MDPAELVDDWPAERVAVIATDRVTGAVTEVGDTSEVFRLASITKVITALAVMVAVEEGTVDLDRALDADLGAPAGVTVRMLLAHAGGYPFESSLGTMSEPLTRRIYSNSGIEMVGDALARSTSMSAVDYITDAVMTPLAMTSTTLSGSVAHGASASASDVSRLLDELLEPTLVSRATIDEMTRIQYPDLAGIVPGVGRFDPCPWGLGVEIRGVKSPHWMGRATSPRTFGHFGGAGTMAWVDPESRRTLVALTDLPFDQWGGTAVRHWGTLSDLVSGARPA